MCYDFLGLLPTYESLAVRGRRLQETAQQRQSKIYAPDILPKIQVEACDRRIGAAFTDDLTPILAHGETVTMNIQLENIGSVDVGEVWLVHGVGEEVWQGVDESISSEYSGSLFQTPSNLTHGKGSASSSKAMTIANSILPTPPCRIPLSIHYDIPVLKPGINIDIPLTYHASRTGENRLYFLLVFSEVRDLLKTPASDRADPCIRPPSMFSASLH